MSFSIVENPVKNDRIIIYETDKQIMCSKCGGNGYVKSSPNCYHTCLNCFGKGYNNMEIRTKTIK